MTTDSVSLELRLDPPSGYADSYLDVEFTVEFEKLDNVKLRLFNETTSEQLDILGVTSGYIANGNEVVCKNCSEIIGHINIFNDDKMNNFKTKNSVIIRCELEFKKNGESFSISEKTTFYNESESLDIGIIPFDLSIHNAKIDIENNEDLTFDIMSNMDKDFEICLRSTDEIVSCPIEISTRMGKTTINVPSEMIYYDLHLNTNNNKEFKLYYVKYQGTNFSRLANRRYIPISNTSITFDIGIGLTSQPQKCNSPTGASLSNSFMISDRYLVPCPKEHSGLTPKTEFGLTKLMDLTMLLYESQDMKKVSDEIKAFSVDDSQEKIKETKRKLRASQMIENPKRAQISAYQFQMLRTHSTSYDKVSQRYSTNVIQPPAKTVSTFSHVQVKKDSGCLPCAKKRRVKNA